MDHSHLNPEQRRAVMSTEGPLLVLAGAGSGKTTVLIERIAQIIRQGTPPWAVLAITFTNKASGELKSRLERMLGSKGLEVWASTFHSACVRILRRDIERLGYASSFTIYDTDDSRRVMKSVLKALNLDDKRFPPQTVLGSISKAKDMSLSPAAYEKTSGGDYYAEKVADCYKEYQRLLKDANALDFDDIIMLTVRLFKEHPDTLAYYQRRFSYILVDEYQDTNMLQYELVSLLAAGHRNLCVVGDDDQSIYRFRGATIENILNFEEQYPDARVIRLEQNYRSTGAILECANRVIAKNRGRKGKTLWTGKEEGEPISFFEAYSDTEEARFFAENIIEGVRIGRKFRDFCVLYRINAQSNRIENAFKAAGIPYRIIGGVRFFDRQEVKDVLAYLQVTHNPHDDLRFMRVVNNPTRGIGDKTLSIVQALAQRDGVSVYQVAANASRYPELGRSYGNLEKFARMIASLGERSAELSLPDFYDEVLERSGYLRFWTEKNDVEAEGRLENIWELKSNLAQYADGAPEPTLGGFLDEVALFTDIEKYDENADAVVMMTIHSAKGLEFPVVFLAGAEENIFPGTRSQTDPQEIEEERRLCYVAVTRAEEKLHVACARERMLFGQTMHNPPSRFVSEMGLKTEKRIQAEDSETVFARRTTPTARARAAAPSAPREAVKAMDVSKGEMVEHRAFGRGMVTGVTPMGGDALIEIAFDTVGTKRLMLKSASQFMKKLDN